MQIFHGACQRFFLAADKLSKMPIVVNSFHSCLIFQVAACSDKYNYLSHRWIYKAGAFSHLEFEN